MVPDQATRSASDPELDVGITGTWVQNTGMMRLEQEQPVHDFSSFQSLAPVGSLGRVGDTLSNRLCSRSGRVSRSSDLELTGTTFL